MVGVKMDISASHKPRVGRVGVDPRRRPENHPAPGCNDQAARGTVTPQSARSTLVRRAANTISRANLLRRRHKSTVARQGEQLRLCIAAFPALQRVALFFDVTCLLMNIRTLIGGARVCDRVENVVRNPVHAHLNFLLRVVTSEKDE